MPKYIVLWKFTDQGAKDISTLPQRAQSARQAAQQHGVNVLGWYLTMGSYDVVTIVEASDEATVAAGLLAIAKNGNFRSESLRAFDENETEQLIQKLGQ
jgi:uncharacterized protein with GYD domain